MFAVIFMFVLFWLFMCDMDNVYVYIVFFYVQIDANIGTWAFSVTTANYLTFSRS